jgi:hypothetical protein
MHFENPLQRGQVAEVLHDLMGVGEDIWDHDAIKPNTRGSSYYRWHKKTFTQSEDVLYRIAWSVWNKRDGDAKFSELWNLDAEHLKAVGSLFIAMANGIDAIDEWLEVWGRPELEAEEEAEEG